MGAWVRAWVWVLASLLACARSSCRIHTYTQARICLQDGVVVVYARERKFQHVKGLDLGREVLGNVVSVHKLLNLLPLVLEAVHALGAVGERSRHLAATPREKGCPKYHADHRHRPACQHRVVSECKASHTTLRQISPLHPPIFVLSAHAKHNATCRRVARVRERDGERGRREGGERE